MYSRVLDGKTLTFGVSGKLWKNALVMYDRETGSLWSHMTGECLEGHYKGRTLKMLASTPIVKWKAWREAHPDTKVLTVRGREDRRRDNYYDYHASSRTGLFPTEHRDRRFGSKDLVVGVALPDAAKAYPLGRKRWRADRDGHWKLVSDTVGGTPIVVYHDPDNFTTSVYDRTVGDAVLSFASTAEGILAADTEGRRWNMLTGTGPDGARLTPIPHLNVYWFAWVDFYPNAALYAPED